MCIFLLFFYYYKFKSDCCESTSASCYRYLIKLVLTYYPRVLSSKMNNYRGQVYVIIMFVSSLQTFIILGVCKCIKPPIVLRGVPQCQLRLFKIHNISWKPNTGKIPKTVYSSQYYPLLHCRRGVRRLFGYDITGSSYRSTVKLTCRWSSLEGWLLAAVWPMQSLVEQGYLLSSLYLLESALQLDNWLFWVLMIQLTRQKAKDFLTL